MPKTDDLFHTGHRERLKEKLLGGKLTGYEKLELLLMYAIPRRDVRPLARKLLEVFGGVYFVLHAPIEELMAVPGVGRNTAILIKLVCELNLVAHTERAISGKYLSDEKFRFDYCRNLVAGSKVEEFHILYLDGDYKLLAEETHTRGTINETAVYIREITKGVLRLNAASVIIVHNHPVSTNNFSQTDITTTQNIEHVLQTLNIRLIDHLLVTASGTVFSYRALPWARKQIKL